MSKRLRVLFLPTVENNPYQELLAHHLEPCGFDVRCEPLEWKIRRGAPYVDEADIIHIHWLRPLLWERRRRLALAAKLARFIFSLIRLRRRGKKIFWTVHNLYTHERQNYYHDRALRWCLARCAHRLITHCQTAQQTVAQAYGLRADKISVVPHAHYIDRYPNTISKAQARQQLNIDGNCKLLLFLGLIRPYKGVLEMIDAFDRLDSDARLLIAGRTIKDDMAAMLQQRVERSEQVQLMCRFIEDEQMQVLINASDVMVFPYRDMLTSGAVMLGMSFGRACIAPRMGCIKDLLDERGGFTYDPEDDDGLFAAIKRALAGNADLDEMGRHHPSEALQSRTRLRRGTHC